MIENLGAIIVEKGSRKEPLSAVEKLGVALEEVRESLLARLNCSSMEEVCKSPTNAAAVLKLMIGEYHNQDTNGENYYRIEAAAEILSIFERALLHQNELDKHPQAAAALR